MVSRTVSRVHQVIPCFSEKYSRFYLANPKNNPIFAIQTNSSEL